MSAAVSPAALARFTLSSCKFEQPIPLGSLRPHAPRAPSASICGNRNRYPCCVECESGKKDELTGNGSNRCSHPKLLHRGDRRRGEEKLQKRWGPLAPQKTPLYS